MPQEGTSDCDCRPDGQRQGCGCRTAV